jgi:O-antigen ligase
MYESDLGYIEQSRTSSASFPVRVVHFISGFVISVFQSIFEKFRKFFRNIPAMAVTSILLLHVIGLLYTTDFHYAFKDLRTKLPLLLLPLFLSTGPRISTRVLHFILIGYTLAVFGGTLYRLYLFFNLSVADTRALYAHTSHIRFSLNAVFAIFILIYFIVHRKEFQPVLKFLFVILALWLLSFLVYMRYTTGISIFLLISVFILIHQSIKGTSSRTKVLWLSAGLFVMLTPVFFIAKVVRQYHQTAPVSFNMLDTHTPSGNSYYHDTVNFRIEKNQYVGLYICDKELRREWKKRSQISIDSLDGKGQPIRSTLIRYLASLDLRKDSTGISQLTQKDVLNIESGMTNISSKDGLNLYNQVDNFLIGWENYRKYGNPNSSSLIQRLEYWRTSLILIRQHPIIGVGTGDVPQAFRDAYEQTNSSLEPKFRLRSHNQYLSITVAFGITGLVWFILALIYPVIRNKGFSTSLFAVFWIIFMISMLTEDTIETQEGVTFFAYFTSLFLFALIQDTETDTAS